MTSEERHQARFQRRRAARAAAKDARLATADNYEQVFSYGNLYQAYRKSRRNVAWKASVQRYITQAPLNVYRTWERLQAGTYTSPPFFEFDIYERGKRRHIKSTIIAERVVQRCLCDNALIPAVTGSFIYDNGACMKGKGYDFAVNRLRCHLQRYIRHHGPDGYIMVCDLKSFFDSIMHWAVSKILAGSFRDLRLIGITEDLIRQFDPTAPPEARKGLGLGSQISQVLAPEIAGALDHYVKEVLRIRYYGRYMDDFYLIYPDKEYLQFCKEKIRVKCESLGLVLSEKKTQIVKLTHGFTWLKVRWYVTGTGKVIKKMHRSSITRERRKLKKLRHKLDAGEIAPQDAFNSFQSWRSHCRRFKAWHTLQSMTTLYAQLFVARR